MDIQITDPASGRSVTIEWDGDQPPTAAEKAEILAFLQKDDGGGPAAPEAAAPAAPAKQPGFLGDVINRGIENVKGLGSAALSLTPASFFMEGNKFPGQALAEGMVGGLTDTLSLTSPGAQKVGAAIGRGAGAGELAIRGAAAGLDPVFPASDAVDGLFAGRPGVAVADIATALAGGKLYNKVAGRVTKNAVAPPQAAPTAAPRPQTVSLDALDIPEVRPQARPDLFVEADVPFERFGNTPRVQADAVQPRGGNPLRMGLDEFDVPVAAGSDAATILDRHLSQGAFTEGLDDQWLAAARNRIPKLPSEQISLDALGIPEVSGVPRTPRAVEYPMPIERGVPGGLDVGDAAVRALLDEDDLIRSTGRALPDPTNRMNAAWQDYLKKPFIPGGMRGATTTAGPSVETILRSFHRPAKP